MSHSTRLVRMPRWASVVALLSLATLASFGLRWCVSMVNHSAPAHCHSCGADMDVADHISWWQSQTVATATTEVVLLLVVLLVLASTLATPSSPPLVSVSYLRNRWQRFRPPDSSYLVVLLADGILNPKVFSVVR